MDAGFSLETEEMASLVIKTERAWQAQGQVNYGVADVERNALVYRRSLCVAEDRVAGEPFKSTNLRAIRPGLGLSPKHASSLLGRRARQAIKRGTPMDWSLA